MSLIAHDPSLALRVRDVGVFQRDIDTTAAAPANRGGRARTFGRGRRCACGTVLSRYNPRGECAACEATA